MLEEIRIACAVPAVCVCNCQQNARDICSWIDKAEKAGCDVVIFPELALTGATCEDLFCQQLMKEQAAMALVQIVAETRRFPKVTLVLGAPVWLFDRLYNCGVIVREGKVLGIAPKQDLPAEQLRWFSSPSGLPGAIDGAALGLADHPAIPVDPHVLTEICGVPACVCLGRCEDPGELAVPEQADLILHLSAEPAFAGDDRRFSGFVAQLDRPYAYVSAGATESNRDYVFSGRSLIAAQGVIAAGNDRTAASDYMLVHSITPKTGRAKASEGSVYSDPKRPWLRDVPVKSYALSVFQIQCAGLARRLQLLHARPVVGVSGGLDSTLALLVCAEAVRMLGRPVSDVVGITMPCYGTTERTKNNATELMTLLGVTAVQIDIFQAVSHHFADIGHPGDVADATYENAQARERTQVLMDYAGMVGGIVVGTGDLSELALGWCTYNADQMSMYGVNCSVLKSLIPDVIRAAASVPVYSKAVGVLEQVIATPISPELLPPDREGRITQCTEDLVGPYGLHDFFLYHVLKGTAPRRICGLACAAFADEYDAQTVKKWLHVFYRRFFSQQYKRSCMPEGVQVSDLSLSPRGGWQMPSDAAADLWLREVEAL